MAVPTSSKTTMAMAAAPPLLSPEGGVSSVVVSSPMTGPPSGETLSSSVVTCDLVVAVVADSDGVAVGSSSSGFGLPSGEIPLSVATAVTVVAAAVDAEVGKMSLPGDFKVL